MEACLSLLIRAGGGNLHLLQQAVVVAGGSPEFMAYAENLGLSKSDSSIIYQKLWKTSKEASEE